MATSLSKTCSQCGMDVSGQRRIKNSSGAYFCHTCWASEDGRAGNDNGSAKSESFPTEAPVASVTTLKSVGEEPPKKSIFPWDWILATSFGGYLYYALMVFAFFAIGIPCVVLLGDIGLSDDTAVLVAMGVGGVAVAYLGFRKSTHCPRCCRAWSAKPIGSTVVARFTTSFKTKERVYLRDAKTDRKLAYVETTKTTQIPKEYSDQTCRCRFCGNEWHRMIVG